jgi:hypothetical protein
MADLLERDMEDAVARCPSLFIESGLELLHRQIVINGRRPDLVFQDGLSRHLLVELQRGPSKACLLLLRLSSQIYRDPPQTPISSESSGSTT